MPWAGLEDKNKQSASTVGMLDAGSKLSSQITGSNLAPGQYKCNGSIDSLLKKTTGIRGPYDLYTGDRYKVTKKVVSIYA